MEIRTTFHRKLKEIQDDILLMGSMSNKAILSSVEALKYRNLELAKRRRCTPRLQRKNHASIITSSCRGSAAIDSR